ncbi:MAG: DUF72 domain-containing protein [Dehalococcoidia bacterium]|nr:DUF72 domain-containing protein [Dehalococcoidia bacterium]
MEIRVGTSGWHYKHWRGDFYPAELPSRAWFEHYAEHFDTVELNNSFYRQPTPAAWDLWRAEAPPGFVFAVKGSRFVTHLKRLAVEQDSVDLVMNGARRLGSHLGPVLWQLPPGFHRDERTVARLDRFLAMLPRDVPQVFEFRHDSWFGEDTRAQLDRCGASFCAYHMPGLEAPLHCAGGVVYVRFHGSTSKYGGGYSDTELRHWATRIRNCGESADAHTAYVYFNNDIGGHAPRDAERLRELLG